MINVNIREISFLELKAKGYVLQQNDNTLTVRNEENKTLAEIIYFAEINEILVSTFKEFVWCKRIIDIKLNYDGCLWIRYSIKENNRINSIKTLTN